MTECLIFRSEGSHDKAMWWRPNSQGYTYNISEAGIYNLEEATRIQINSMGEDFPVPVSALLAMPMQLMVEAYQILNWRKEMEGAKNPVA